MSTGPLSTSTDQPRRVPASLLAVAAIFSVQFGNALVGSLFDRVGPLGAAALRLCFAAFLLLALVRPRVRGWRSSAVSNRCAGSVSTPIRSLIVS